MNDILKTILNVKKNEVSKAEDFCPLETVKQKAANAEPTRGFYRAITKNSPGTINVIAEIKRASPSAGLIFNESEGQVFDPKEIAKKYEIAGASAISVLTDEQFFKGKLEYIGHVKRAIDLPVLRKDFIISPYQIYEARAAGADAILLIAEALNTEELASLIELAHSLKLTVLLEVHEAASLFRVRDLITSTPEREILLGINNRNLKTMTVDIMQSITLGETIDNKKILISESGIKTRTDVRRLIDAGFAGTLIGETLMASGDISAKFKELFAI